MAVNVAFWVSAAAKPGAAPDQLSPFFSKGVSDGFSQNLPLILRRHDARLRDPSLPSLY